MIAILFDDWTSGNLGLRRSIESVGSPLFNDSATAIGRLLRFQDDFTLGQLHRRLIQSWGERATGNRAYQRVIRSMVERHTLNDTGEKGHFSSAHQRSTRLKRLQVWLLKASHIAHRTGQGIGRGE